MSRGEAQIGGMPGGASSKGDTDRRLSARNIKKILREAPLSARDLPDPGEAFEKASGGVYTRTKGEMAQMSAESLFRHINANAADLGEMGNGWVAQKFALAGMQREYNVLNKGAQAEHTARVEAEIKAALLAKSITEMNKDELDYLSDKFGELGLNIEKTDNRAGLLAALGNFISDNPTLEQNVTAKSGVITPRLQLQ